MSCDESKEAQRNAKRSRSLTIVKQEPGAPAPGPLETAPTASTPPRYWRSLEERERTPSWEQAANREFPPGASEMDDGVSRRSFMQLVGVSTAVAGLGVACRKPNEKIVPFVRRPEEMTDRKSVV